MGFSIWKINTNTYTRICLYDYISDMNDVELLAQLAMSQRDSDYDELIYIMPGSNRSIKRNPEEYQKALELAEQYKNEDAEYKKFNFTQIDLSLNDVGDLVKGKTIQTQYPWLKIGRKLS